MLVITYSLVDMFDTLGTLYGASAEAGMLDENGDPEKVGQCMLCDSIGTVAGACLGTSTVTTFVESASGVEAGGRTGLTALVCGLMFLACMFIAPIAAIIPAAATSAALIYVGVLMLQGLSKVDFNDITLAGIREMQTMEPFGLQNPQPVLMMKRVAVTDLVYLSGGKHLKFKLRPHDYKFGGSEVSAIWFSVPSDLKLSEGNICDVVFTADINEYMGQCTPQVTIKALRLSDIESEDTAEGEVTYRRLVDPADRSDVSRSDVPTLAGFRDVYKFLKRDVLESSKHMAIAATCRALEQEDIHVSYCSFKVILDVLADEGLISRTYSDGGKVAEVSILPVGKKVNLDQSPILQMIRGNHRQV